MKKRILSLISAVLLLQSAALADCSAPSVSAESMILIHSDSGKVLAQKNPDKRMLIASTTKIMTALVALERGQLHMPVEIRPDYTIIEGSSMYLRPGSVYSLEDLITGLLLVSGNDAALAVAEAVAGEGKTDLFVQWMNERAESLHLRNTHFSNPHGLDGDDHYSTAEDLAVIMAAAMRNPDFSRITGMKNFSCCGSTYVNHNKLLWRCEGVNGGKTGYTRAAGRCLISSCSRNNLSLICVTLSDPDDWADHAKLYEWAFSEFQPLNLPAGRALVSVPVISGQKDRVPAGLKEDFKACVPAGHTVRLEYFLPHFVFANIHSGDSAGFAEISVGDSPPVRRELVWADTVPVTEDPEASDRKSGNQPFS